MSPALIRPATEGVGLRELVARLGARPDHQPDADPLVTGVSLDSRTVTPGDLYAALPGFNVHGADFAAQAFERGAVAVLTDAAGAERVPAGVPVVVVERPREVLGAVAAQVYGDPSADLTMIGVTGTNGKTTTAYLIESALRAHGRRTGLIGTVETRLGDEVIDSERTTPEATDLHALLALMRERGLDTCVMEVSSHALALHRVDGVVYDVALFTNLSQDHLDFHADMLDYYRAKASLFTPARSRLAVVGVDDDWGVRLATEASVPVTTVSTTDAPADWMVDRRCDDGEFTLRARDGSQLRLVSHLTGTFNVANTALAALALVAIGLDHRAVEAAMSVPPDVPGRMQLVAAGAPGSGDRSGWPRCIVDFAHTPDAVDAALLALRPSTSGRLIVVLGAGGDRDRGKRPLMGAAAARHADVVVVTDDNPRSEPPNSIRAAVLTGARQVIESGSATATELIDGGARALAIAQAVALGVGTSAARETVDTVIVLGKGHEKGQEIDGVTHPFDDRDALLAALSAATSGAHP
ncbi:MAG: UDP-N-acetylmuramoyl-L-alanyl-D-glutamate--2,6-diaminopimelate ligase [Terracoccus sp.]